MPDAIKPKAGQEIEIDGEAYRLLTRYVRTPGQEWLAISTDNRTTVDVWYDYEAKKWKKAQD